jgi:hypothetical protein
MSRARKVAADTEMRGVSDGIGYFNERQVPWATANGKTGAVVSREAVAAQIVVRAPRVASWRVTRP